MMPPDATSERRRTTIERRSGLISKSKFVHRPQVHHTLSLERRVDGRPFLIVASTFEPRQEGNFELTVTSPDDAAMSLVELERSEELSWEMDYSEDEQDRY